MPSIASCKAFHRPQEFDLHEHLAKSFGVFRGEGEVHVKARFTPGVARYVTESSWHSSQKLTWDRVLDAPAMIAHARLVVIGGDQGEIR